MSELRLAQSGAPLFCHCEAEGRGNLRPRSGLLRFARNDSRHPILRVSVARGTKAAAGGCRVGLGAAWLAAVLLACIASAAPAQGIEVNAGRPKETITVSVPGPSPYPAQWLPFILHLSDSALFMPDSHAEILKLTQEQGVITGLTSAPCGDLVIYALTTPAGSRIMGITTAVQQSGPFADAAPIGEDAWFHDPMSLSPDGRWLLVTASSNRRETLAARAAASTEASDSFGAYTGDLWLMDCAKAAAPRRIAADSRLRYCSWAPSGRFAVCEVASRPNDATEPKAVLLDAGSGETKPLAEGHVHAAWSGDGTTLRLLRAAAGGTELLEFDLSAGDSASPRSKRLVNWQLPTNAVWSHDGTVGGYVWERDGQTGVSLVDTSGSTREVEFKPGVRSLLGWSCRGELLACVGADGHLHFCTGAVSTASYERLASIAPNPPGISPSAREGHAMQTSKSPVSVISAAPAAAWAEAREGPCLIYVDTPSKREQTIYKLCFKRTSLQDFGIDPKADLREQVIRQVSTSNLRQVALAFLIYADGHGGRLPPHASGRELLEDLKGSFKSPSVLSSIVSSPYGGGEIRVVLLLPGENLNDLKPEEKARIPMAELWSDDGHLFVAYANGSVKQVH